MSLKNLHGTSVLVTGNLNPLAHPQENCRESHGEADSCSVSMAQPSTGGGRRGVPLSALWARDCYLILKCLELTLENPWREPAFADFAVVCAYDSDYI